MVIDFSIVHEALEANEVGEVAGRTKRSLQSLKLDNSESVIQNLSELVDDAEIKHDKLCQYLLSTMPTELQDYLKVYMSRGMHTSILDSSGLGYTCWGQNLTINGDNHTRLEFHLIDGEWVCDSFFVKEYKLDVPCKMGGALISTNFYRHNYKV